MTLMPVSNIFSSGRLLFERRRGAVNRPALLRLHRPIGEVDRLAEHVQHAAERLRADRHRDRRAGVDRRHAARQAVGRLHRDGAHAVLAEVLLDLDDDLCPVVVLGGDGAARCRWPAGGRASNSHVDHSVR